LEHSISSTKPHTVNLYANTQELPISIVEIAPTRHLRVTAVSTILNSDRHIEVLDNISADASASNSHTNDIVT